MTNFCFWNDGSPVPIRNALRAKSPTGVVLQSINRAMPDFDVFLHVDVGSSQPSAPGKIVTANHVLDGDTVTTTYTEADNPNYPAEDRIAGLFAVVNAERDRRRYPGNLDTELGWPVDLRDERDERNITGKVSLALAIKVAASGETIGFMGADNQVHTLSADDMIAVGRAVDAWVTAVYTASWAVKVKIAAGAISTVDDVKNSTDWP